MLVVGEAAAQVAGEAGVGDEVGVARAAAAVEVEEEEDDRHAESMLVLSGRVGALPLPG
jgi:hypothetical protein